MAALIFCAVDIPELRLALSRLGHGLKGERLSHQPNKTRKMDNDS